MILDELKGLRNILAEEYKSADPDRQEQIKTDLEELEDLIKEQERLEKKWRLWRLRR